MTQTSLIIRDLGELTGDVLVFGGPYSNLQATQAMIAWAADRNIPVCNRICTGDVMAYCASPDETWKLVAQSTAAIVAGNCEKQLGAGLDACGCGFEQGSACDIAARGWYAYATPRAKPYKPDMLACPDIAIFHHQGKRYAVIHGGVSDIARFIWPDSAVEAFEDEIDAIIAQCGPVDGVFCGHSGIAFQRRIGAVHWINAGVIGIPPHDGRPETRFARLHNTGVHLERLTYDWSAALAAMVAAGLDQGYAQSLDSGIWPNEEILPASLHR